MEKTRLLNLGYGNIVPVARVVAVVNPTSNPMRHLRDEARKSERLIDATQGKKTRSIVVMDSNHIILSAFSPETLGQRIEQARQSDDSVVKE